MTVNPGDSFWGSISIKDVISFVGLIAAFAAVVWQIYATRCDQRRKHTLDLITEWRLPNNLFFAKLRILKEGEHTERFVFALIADSNPQNKDVQWIDKRNDLIWLISYFELISVGVDAKIYDEKILVESASALFVESYDRLEGFIVAWRHKNEQSTCCEHFERFTEKLRKHQAKEQRKHQAKEQRNRR